MKIKVDKENKVVVAYGGYHGKRIRAVAVCKETFFDEEFGIKLATKKFKIKERYVKMKEHESFIKTLNKAKAKIDAMVADHEKSANYLDMKIQEDTESCDNFVQDYFAE